MQLLFGDQFWLQSSSGWVIEGAAGELQEQENIHGPACKDKPQTWCSNEHANSKQADLQKCGCKFKQEQQQQQQQSMSVQQDEQSPDVIWALYQSQTQNNKHIHHTADKQNLWSVNPAVTKQG
jgi:hypothetical protein